jgi:hypothetical protein
MNPTEQETVDRPGRQPNPAPRETREVLPDRPTSRPSRVPHRPPPLFLVVLAHALIAFALANVLSLALNGLPGFRLFFYLVNCGAFFPFGASIAAGMHEQRGLAILIAIVTIMAGWPFSMNTLPHLLIPIAVGLLIGMGLSRVLHEGRQS